MRATIKRTPATAPLYWWHARRFGMLYVPWPFAPRCLLKQCLAEALNCRSGTSACKITHTAQNKYSIYIERILEKRYIRVYIPPVEAKHLHKHFVCVLGKVCYYIPHLHIRRRRRRTVKNRERERAAAHAVYIYRYHPLRDSSTHMRDALTSGCWAAS